VTITKVVPVAGELVEVSGTSWSTYYRYSPDNWQVSMGESIEPVLLDMEIKEIETAYQVFKKDK